MQGDRFRLVLSNYLLDLIGFGVCIFTLGIPAKNYFIRT